MPDKQKKPKLINIYYYYKQKHLLTYVTIRSCKAALRWPRTKYIVYNGIINSYVVVLTCINVYKGLAWPSLACSRNPNRVETHPSHTKIASLVWLTPRCAVACQDHFNIPFDGFEAISLGNVVCSAVGFGTSPTCLAAIPIILREQGYCKAKISNSHGSKLSSDYYWFEKTHQMLIAFKLNLWPDWLRCV